jgi:hypothetical protein
MKNFDLNNLDFNNSGAWPVPIKAFFAALIVIVILFLGWYSFVSNQQSQVEQLQRTEQDLRRDFEAKQAKAVNLEPLTAQLKEMEAMLHRNAGSYRRYLTNCVGIRYPERVVSASAREPQGFLRRKANLASDGGVLSPVR